MQTFTPEHNARYLIKVGGEFTGWARDLKEVRDMCRLYSGLRAHIWMRLPDGHYRPLSSRVNKFLIRG